MVAFWGLLAGCTGNRDDARNGDDAPVDGGETMDADAAPDAEDAAGPELPPIVFQACTLSIDDADVAAECAFATVPLLHDDPEGETISLYVERFPARAEAQARLWLLEGGPGLPATDLEPLALALHDALPDWDVFVSDPRGTGLSARFECPLALTENAGGDPLPDCGAELTRQWGTRTAAFSATEAARDVLSLVQRTGRMGQPVWLYGRSFGGYVVNRIAQIEPTLAAGLVLDSAFVPSGEQSMLDAAARPDEAGRALLRACGTDSECSAHLGSDPATAALAALDAVESCPALVESGWSRDLVQALLSVLVDDAALRGLIPAAFFRVARCGPTDGAWFDRFAELATWGAPNPDPARKSSTGLFAHILLSELVAASVPAEELADQRESSVFSTALQLEPYNAAHSLWPRYESDGFVGGFATSGVPLVILHGALDGRVPLHRARSIFDHVPLATSRFVEFSQAGHLIVGRAPDSSGEDCGLSLLLAFLTDPEGELDASCAANSPALAFTATEEVLTELSPSGDPWD